MPGGRPTSFDDRYCEEIVELMRDGKSLTAAIAELGFSRQTAYDWMDAHPQFLDAVKRGRALCTAWWETRLRQLSQTGGGPGGATATIFALKNIAPEDWREKSHQEISGPDGGPITTEEVSARDILARKLAGLTGRDETPSGSGKSDGSAG